MSLTTTQTSGTAAVTIAEGTAAAQAPALFDEGFIQRLEIIGTLVALAVTLETPQVASRTAFAHQFLADPATLTRRTLMFAAVADGVTNAASTDQQIANRIGEVWTALAGAYG